MRVLSHGVPFYLAYTLLDHYRGGHEIQSIGAHPEPHYRYQHHYDFQKETLSDVIERLQWTPDLLICWSPEEQPPPRGIEDAPCKTLAVVSDWNLYYPRLSVNLSRFDLVLCDLPGVTALTSDMVRPAYKGPVYSRDPSYHHPHKMERDIDLLYVGTFLPHLRTQREHFLGRMAALGEKYRVVIAEGYRFEAYARLLSRARLVFNHSVRGEVNLRTLETIACGAAPMLEEENEEGHALFTGGWDIVFYNEENFEEVISQYLDGGALWATVAESSHNRSAEFAGENRLDRWIDWAMETPSGGRPFNSLTAEDKAYQDWLMHSGSWYPAVIEQEREQLRRLEAVAQDSAPYAAAQGYHFTNLKLNPRVDAEGVDALAGRCAEAFAAAHEKAPQSVPYALNAAWAHEWAGHRASAVDCLEAALKADSPEGAELLLGNYHMPFYVPWLESMIHGKASVAFLHAEAHHRLARHYRKAGDMQQARLHLEAARQHPAYHSITARDWAEALWENGNRSAAIDALRQHLRFVPFDYAARDMLCAWLASVGDTAEAKAEKAITARFKAVRRALG